MNEWNPFNFTHPKQEAEEEEKISYPGVDEGERLSPVQVQLSIHTFLSISPTFSSLVALNNGH